MFKLWSEISPEKKRIISLTLGLREWSELTTNDKENILHHFNSKGWMLKNDEDITASMIYLMNTYKKENYCKKTLEISAKMSVLSPRDRYYMSRIDLYTAAYQDFIEIFLSQKQDVVYEVLSYYAKRQIKTYDEKRVQRFCNCFNDIFENYCINLVITEMGFIPRQDEKIIEKIYKPVFKFLSDSKWRNVSKEVEEALEDYRKKDYDDCIEKISNAIQAYLQSIVHGKVGKGKISTLIPEARKRGLIPDNSFTNQYLENIAKHLGKERVHKSGAHPKKSEANEGNARFLLNLSMVVLQYWLQYRK